MKKAREPNHTIEDVARQAGVSIKTVSRVLNSEPNVRQATRDKVLATAQALGYAPNISARRLAARRSFIVALVYRDDDVNHYIPDIQHGALDVCRERGYNLLLHPCQGSIGDAAHEIEQLARQSLLDGFIVVPPLADSRKLLTQMARHDVPFVRVSQLYRGELSPSVSVGDRTGAYRMVEYLAGLRHRDVGFILGNENQGASIDRLRGYREAIRDFGLRDNPEWVRQGDFTFESGVRCMEELLSMRKRPTAVFASNDDMAAGALMVAHRRGYAIPGEVSIVGFDDITMAQRLWPPLTTVRQPIKRAAAIATGMLLDSLRTRDFTPLNQEVPGELVIRESAAAPARKK
jgi:LacI family transcriptional regulator